MFIRARQLSAAMIFALLPAMPAMAADYDPPMVLDNLQPIDEYVPVEIGSGWYLRGDLGYAFSTAASGTFDYRTFNAVGGTYTANTYDSASVSGGVTYGFGVGYRFTDLLRADLTAERFDIRFNGVRTSANPCAGQPAGTTCSSADSATLTGTSVLANGYVDLGTIAGFTPYIGAGAGLTHVNWSTLTSANSCVSGGVACPGGAVAASTNPGLVSWRFTYAAMAGFAYDVNNKLKINVGYKYRKIAGGPMNGFNATDTGAGATGTRGTDPGFSQHEVKLGVRYEIW